MKQTRSLASRAIAVWLFAFALLLSSVAFAASSANLNTFLGNVTISGSFAKGGSVVDAFIGSASSPIRSYTVGSANVLPANFTVDLPCNAGSTVFLKVWGINATTQACVNQNVNFTNLSVSLVATDGACSYSNGCSSGICCSGTAQVNSSTSSGTCKSTCAAASTDTGGGFSGSSSGGGGGGAAGGKAATEAPTSETVDIVKGSLPDSFKEAAASGNVDYTTVAAPETKAVPSAPESVASAVENVESFVKTEEAKQELSSIQQAVSSGGAASVQSSGGSVSKTIEVVKATNKVSKAEVVVSVVKLSVSAPSSKDLKNVEVVEVIPKLAASNVNQVTFKGEQPAVLEADPVVKWFFPQISKGQTKDLSYTINKDIRNVGTSTVAVQGRADATPPVVAPPAPPAATATGGGEVAAGEVKKPTPVGSFAIVAVVAVLAVGGWLFLKGRKRPMR
ncbi:TPA: hypothetical protein HA231_03735 [Candidatus Woesearchaeota archaeon]|nr:hypothetical protein [Candidatus Woesearchaeota archaeon]